MSAVRLAAPDEHSEVRAVTFDATGTLFHGPRAGEIYAEVLGRHGLEVDPEHVQRTIPEVWQEFDCRCRLGVDRFAAHPEGTRGFWREFLLRICEHLGVPAPSPFAAAELFDRFARAEAWEIYPEAPSALDRLRERGLRLGVVSNWDERLPLLLERLGLAGRFQAIVHSAAVGYEKPRPEIFREALARLALPASQVVHVGDRPRDDVEGASAAGMRPLLLDRTGNGGDLSSLAALPDLLHCRQPWLSGRSHE